MFERQFTGYPEEETRPRSRVTAGRIGEGEGNVV